MADSVPVTRKSQVFVWGHTMTLGKLILMVAAVASIVGTLLSSLGFNLVGPQQTQAEVTARIASIDRKVSARIDSANTQLDKVEGDVKELRQWVRFMVVKDCLDMTPQKKRDMAQAGVSCEVILGGGGTR